jgi:hypothetical protein
MTLASGNGYWFLRNWIDESGVAFSGGSWEANLPLANLAETEPSKVARSTDATLASTLGVIDLGATQAVGGLCFVRHNASPEAQVKITVATDAGFTSVVHAGAWQDILPPTEPFGAKQWGEFRWGGRMSAAELDLFGRVSPIFIGTPVLGRYVKFEIDDTANTDGYVEIERLFVAPGLQPALNFEYGWGSAPTDSGRREQTRGGRDIIEARPRARQVRLTLYLSDAERAVFFDVYYQRGQAGDLVFVAKPNDTVNFLRDTVHGRFARFNLIKEQKGGREFELRVELMEVR